MAATPRWKVYRNSEYVAACRDIEDAAALVAVSNSGEISDGHRKASNVWTEGAEAFSAGESYDRVAQVVDERVRARLHTIDAGRAERGVASVSA